MVKHVDGNCFTLAGQVGGTWIIPDGAMAWCDPGNDFHSTHVEYIHVVDAPKDF